MEKKAIDVMLKEIENNQDPHVDVIHNWLCNQDDEELEVGILKKGKTIAGALKYVKENAQKIATGGLAMVEGATVFGWVRDYFVKEEKKPSLSKKPKAKKEEPELTLEDLI